jgi:hypothetical protein
MWLNWKMSEFAETYTLVVGGAPKTNFDKIPACVLCVEDTFKASTGL